MPQRDTASAKLAVREDLGLIVEYVPPSTLKGYHNHARHHGDRKLQMLQRSIAEFGFLMPLLVDDDNILIAGHARAMAAEALDLAQVPIIRASHLSDAQIKAYRIADNRLAELAEWNEEQLAAEFSALIEVDFDLELTGFEIPEIDIILDAESDPESGQTEDAIEIDEGPVVTQPGQTWLLGEHRIICGDARNLDTLVNADAPTFAMTFIDPPYNRPAAAIGGKGRIKHPNFAMASGEMSQEEFARFLTDVLESIGATLIDGALVFICMDWRSASLLDTVARRLFEPLAWCVWDKMAPGMGSPYRSQHEFVLVFRHGKERHRDNIQLGRFGRNRANIWAYPGVASADRELRTELKSHPTPKPVALVADAILDATSPGNQVLDCFLGTGATLMACEETRRRCTGIEIEPRYVDAAIRRWQKKTGEQALCAHSFRPFNDIALDSKS